MEIGNRRVRNRPQQDQGHYEGVVKHFNSAKGFGWIRCPETYQIYGGDVFLRQDQLGNFSIGDSVMFSIIINDRGQPQAIDLEPTPATLDNMYAEASGTGSASQALLSQLMGKPSPPPAPVAPSMSTQRSPAMVPFPAPEPSMRSPAAFLGPEEVFSMHPPSVSHPSSPPFGAAEPPGPPPPPSAPSAGKDSGDFLLSLLKPKPARQESEADATLKGLLFGKTREQEQPPPAAGLWLGRSPEYHEEHLAMPEDFNEKQVSYLGELRDINPKGYGWIRSARAAEEFGSDILVDERLLKNLQVGDSVNFKLKVNGRGQPQAIEVRRATAEDWSGDQNEYGYGYESAPKAASTSSGFKGQPQERFVGVVMRFDAKKGYGFLRSDSLLEKHGNEHAFVHSKEIREFQQGDDVSFVVKANAKGFQAYALEAHKEYVVGEIKSFEVMKGYGFIKCEKMKEIYGGDVFLHQNEVGKFKAGDSVRFVVKVNKKGQPQAYELEPWQSAAAQDAADESPKFSTEMKTYEGVLKKVDKVKGFGFIFCEELQELHDCDVYVSTGALEGIEVLLGDRVRFTAKVNKKGKPEALDVQPIGLEEDEDDECLSGAIKSFDDAQGYGFIASMLATAKWGRDVFLHRKQLGDFKVGQVVEFIVKINGKGHPQAYKVRAPSNCVLAPRPPAEVPEEEEKEMHIGEIKSFNPMNGYGFIGCAELRERFGRDVFLHESQFEGLKVGDRVSFQLQVKKGQPQAWQVTRISKKLSGRPGYVEQLMNSPSMVPAAEPEGIPPIQSDVLTEELAGLDGDDRLLKQQDVAKVSRKMLRACASARVESVQDVLDALEAGAEVNARDVTGQTAIMISALNVRGSERKCRLLIEHGADIHLPANESLTVLQWARERINPKFAAYLEALSRGEKPDLDVAAENPPEEI
eukprot:CAMPEP_0197630306 /NCGR_PEP_ID=MMETSP1338-20131121/7836_1 /TAXON_ID=43686 ORGANISM="Pelagodinium beii, Strain RCC1491" /NCGR_SAMPLE_ID=MMETSP1338 /ASSEMBLY_ACC=CAM_ASM_000754 /LENGTH=917 /DNA_ID=CAMNT_0043201497 /DNA_START=55 /DNA_END=2808 /DNA_ORIENTATION=+